MIARHGDTRRACAEALKVGEAVEGGASIGRIGLREDGSGDVSVGERKEGDGEGAATPGRE
jgi:hypothetical protein